MHDSIHRGVSRDNHEDQNGIDVVHLALANQHPSWLLCFALHKATFEQFRDQKIQSYYGARAC